MEEPTFRGWHRNGERIKCCIKGRQGQVVKPLVVRLRVGLDIEDNGALVGFVNKEMA